MPVIFRSGALIFWFHSYDALVEGRASVHVGKSSPNDHADAKIWLDPTVQVARSGRTLNQRELKYALDLIAQQLDFMRSRFHEHTNH
jgi:hypothetical protein